MAANPRQTESPPASDRRRGARRRLWDRAVRGLVSIGGLGIICAVLLIFVYLISVVLPLFQSAEISEEAYFDGLSGGRGNGPANESPLLLALDSAAGIALRIGAGGRVEFIDLTDGGLLAQENLTSSAGAELTAVAEDSGDSGLFAAGFADGEIVLAGWDAGGGVPRLVFPVAPRAYRLPSGGPVAVLGLRSGQGRFDIAAAGAGGRAVLFAGGASPGSVAAAPALVQVRELPVAATDIDRILLPLDWRWVFILETSGEMNLLELEPSGAARIAHTVRLAPSPARLTDIEWLAGGVSLLAADSAGGATQWFVVREEGSARLRQIRRFQLFDNAVADLEAERNRRNFMALGGNGELALLNATTEAELLRLDLADASVRALALAPAGELLLLADAQGGIGLWRLDNPFAEFSPAALWHPAWYENYPAPGLIWQTSAADDTFEPKYSLAPLTFGTLKAAFAAMLFAAPLAVGAAVFTGNFMVPGLRRRIKPLIELMEALPTVVIGFLAGLWLAPLVEENLAALVVGLALLPLSVVLASAAMARLPERFERSLAEGWQLLALAPVMLLAGWLAWRFAPLMEVALFDDGLSAWLATQWGLEYASRNALIVGAAMGFAVTPVIYSIADDAIFTVPRHLGYGAFALGANSWQTLVRLILPAAAPGILSALLIGFGRAVGETMIVLMATGNTPIMDVNLFAGMRTLAANLAIEIPESEPGGTHYRILFLSSLLLLLFTFLINSLAELARQRMRRKYRLI